MYATCLTPLEERWETIEDGERAFRATRVRVATDNIELARLGEGLELVRIGRPSRLELATWRYGTLLGRRRRKTLALGARGLAFGSTPFAEFLLTASFGVVSAVTLPVTIIGMAAALKHEATRRVHVPDGQGGWLSLTRIDAYKASLALVPEVSDWGLEITPDAPLFDDDDPLTSWHPAFVARATHRRPRGSTERRVTLPSPLAERALASMLPSLNPEGGSQRQIRHAMDVMGNAVHLRQLLYQVAGAHGRDAASRLGELPTPTRLALEMVLHEDDERRTMEGELAALERRWREAEEVARIADALAIRPEVEAKLRDLRRLPA